MFGICGASSSFVQVMFIQVSLETRFPSAVSYSSVGVKILPPFPSLKMKLGKNPGKYSPLLLTGFLP
jgi:hypothetical protein